MGFVRVKKHLLTGLRLLVPAAILAYLMWTIASDADNVEAVRQIFSRQTRWWSVGLAFGVGLVALSLTFIRWYLLVISVGIPFHLKDAFRLGFLGYLLNFIGVGGVGGDLFKGYLLARDNPGKRPEAVSTIIMDRLIGLYALFVVTSLAALTLDLEQVLPAIRTVCYVVHGATLTGLVIGLLSLLPGFWQGPLRDFLEDLPKVGAAFRRGFTAVETYRRQRRMLLGIVVLSLGVHSLFSTAAYLLAAAMFTQHPTLGEMMVITPLAMVFAALPLSPGGLGTLEIALAELYQNVPAQQMGEASAITVALGFRALTIGLAFIGAVFYWANRASVKQSMAEAAAEEDSLEHLAEVGAEAERAEATSPTPDRQ